MIYEIKREDKTYFVDDLKTFDQQTKEFKTAFNEVEKQNGDNFIIASFDNAMVMLYIKTDRVLISLKEDEDEDN